MRYVLIGLMALIFAPFAAAQACDLVLTEAEQDYRMGQFDQAIDRLTRCLDSGALAGDERRRAYRLIGLSYIGKDREAEAREAVRQLLAVAPGYQPDPAMDPPPFVTMVEEERRTARPVRAQTAPRGTVAPFATEGFFVRGFGAGLSNGIESDPRETGGGGGLALGYGFGRGLAAFAQVEGSSVSGNGGGSYTQAYFDLGVRYAFGEGQFVPYALGALTGQMARLPNVNLGGVVTDVTYSGAAFTLGGGALYFLAPGLALDGGLAFSLGSYSSVEAGGVSTSNFDALSSNAVRVQLGVSWFPGR